MSNSFTNISHLMFLHGLLLQNLLISKYVGQSVCLYVCMFVCMFVNMFQVIILQL